MNAYALRLGLAAAIISVAVASSDSTLAAGAHSAAQHAAATHPAASFAISYPAAQRDTPLDGRIILLLSRDLTREPRSHVEPNEPLASPYLFGLNVDGLAPRTAAVLNDTAFGW